MEIRSGTTEDFEAVATLGGDVEQLRARWQQPSFDPARHLWLADGAFGALYAPDEAVVRGDAAHVPALLGRIEERARAERLSQLTFVIPTGDEPAWRAYEDFGFELATEVLELEIAFDEAPVETPAPEGIAIRTYTNADAHRVRELLDAAYLAWDETYSPLSYEDWLAFMTENASFVPECWFLAEDGDGELGGVCLTWKHGCIKDVAVTVGTRGRGLGDALLRKAFARLHEHGVRRVG